LTHFWRDGLPITLVEDDVRNSLSFRWRRRTHPVEQTANYWRIDANWWDDRVWREYFKVTTDTGLLVLIFGIS
jgi:hypothetical protein